MGQAANRCLPRFRFQDTAIVTIGLTISIRLGLVLQRYADADIST
jgi:hypothetical protein